ncbi:MAG: ATP phosphoribosyltransferase regulatory subunit [Helicobacteraceae bacterium]|nr:ATP phosphoribosyltransferase regulatory subunit [Helicobacteraceae bacterium]
MTLGYEIPQGSKIHFGTSAKIKRDIELKAVDIFYRSGFEEISTPSFSFSNDNKVSRNTIRISSNNNKQMILRNDNTTDVIKIIHRHLGDINHKKWFYIQPFYSYPSAEINQIGAEFLDEDSLGNLLCVAVSIFLELKIEPILQISNMNIPRLCAKEGNLDIEIFSKAKIDSILKSASYFASLVSVQTKQELESYIKVAPSFLKEELENLLHIASYCHYENTIFSPLYYSPNGYYDSLFFRMFDGNKVLLLGGRYEIDEIKSCGFAIYTNDVVDYILNKVG